MNLYELVIDEAKSLDNVCNHCNHPTGNCSGGCYHCLKEIHDWHCSRAPSTTKRNCYNCKKLVTEYVKTFASRYYENIKSACKDIDLSKYDNFTILSLGCGASPDLMAFEELAQGKQIFYRGMDDNSLWEEYHAIIKSYTDASNIDCDFVERDILDASGQANKEIYNVVIFQFVISSILSEGGRKAQVIDLFKSIVNSALQRWYTSDSTSPFLIILNDTDSLNTGRDLFYGFLDILEEKGYCGVSYAYSNHANGDLGQERWSRRKTAQGYGNITYNYSNRTSNNSATLSIEVKK